MTTVQRIWLLAGFLAIVLHAGDANALAPLQIANEAFPGSPCHNQPITITWNPELARTQSAGEATGVNIMPDGTYQFVGCAIALEPRKWAILTPARQCEVLVHEAGHLAGLHHTASGIMTPVVGYWALCHTVRERVQHDVALRVPDDALVMCGRWEHTGRAMWCVAEWQSARNWLRRARFRVRALGDVYTIRRVKLGHPELHH